MTPINAQQTPKDQQWIDDREPIAEGDYRYYWPSRLDAVPPPVPKGQDEKMPTAETEP